MSLKEVHEENYPSLIEKTKLHFPGIITIHGWLQVAARFGTPKWSQAKVWTLENPEKNRFFVIITDAAEAEFQSINLYWSMDAISRNDAAEILATLPNFNWDKLFFLTTTYAPILKELSEIMKSHRLGSGPSRRVIDAPAAVYTCKPLDLTDIPLPPGFRMGRLSLEHSEYVHANWENNIDFPTKAIDYFIDKLETIAIYTDNPEDNGQPVSWTIFKMDGQVGATFTNPDFRGKKLGSIVTVELFKRLAQRNFDSYVLIEDDNHISIKMHEKIGFTKVGDFAWEFYCGNSDDIIPQNAQERLEMLKS